MPSEPSSTNAAAAGNGVRLLWATSLLLWLGLTLPLALGWRTFYLRDVFKTHLALEAFGAQQLAQGRIPALDPTRGLGQPFRGNPNALPFYPGRLLYLVLPLFPAFNLHYALHWLLALLAMHALARRLGQSPPAAWLAAVTYAGAGWMLSALTFYNLLTVAAWWPLVVAGAVEGGAAGVAAGGLACGMALLGGEPVTAALGVVPLLVAALRAHGFTRGLRVTAGVLALGGVVALPQIVATLRVLPFTVRGTGGLSAEAAVAGGFSLHPQRLLELLVPLPFGSPTRFGAGGFWTGPWAPIVPLFMSLYVGLPALWLALRALRRQRAWAALAAAGYVLAMLPQLTGAGLARATGGLFRHPEKLLFWSALALPLLAGFGLDRLPVARARVATATGAALALLGIAIGVAAPHQAELAGAALARRGGLGGTAFATPGAAEASVLVHLGLWALGLAVGGACLALAARAHAAGRLAVVGASQLASLLLLAPLWTTDDAAPYRATTAWAQRLAGEEVAVTTLPDRPWQPAPAAPAEGTRAVAARLFPRLLYPAYGVPHGLRYPLPEDVDGMVTPSLAATGEALFLAGWEERRAMLRRLGVTALVATRTSAAPPWPRLASQDDIELLAVPDPAPPAWWPSRVTSEPLAADDDWRTVRIAAAPPQLQGRGGVRLLAAGPDRLLLETAGEGGVAVVRRAWLPLWRARLEGGQPAATVEVDGLLLGVAVPPGAHRVTVDVSAVPESTAGAIALLAALAALAVLVRGRPARRGATAPRVATPS